MARYVTSIATPLSPDEAFAYLADVTRFAEWDPGVTRAVRVAGDGGVGTAYDLTVKAGSTSVMRYEVTAYEAPRRLLLVARTALLRSVDEIRVEPASGGGATVTYDATLTLNGPLGLFDPLLRLAFDRIGDRGAAGLRRALKGGTVTGR
jgi:hypothetical protein